MKKLTKQILLVTILFGVVNLTYAKSKVAHIDAKKLLESMPEMIAATSEFNNLQQKLTTEIQQFVTQYKNKITQYSNEALTKTEDENASRKNELSNLEQKIQEAQANAQQRLDKEYIKLTKSVQEKAMKAIQKVGKSRGFDYVLDSSIGSGVLLADGIDLLNDVKKELEIK